MRLAPNIVIVQLFFNFFACIFGEKSVTNRKFLLAKVIKSLSPPPIGPLFSINMNCFHNAYWSIRPNQLRNSFVTFDTFDGASKGTDSDLHSMSLEKWEAIEKSIMEVSSYIVHSIFDTSSRRRSNDRRDMGISLMRVKDRYEEMFSCIFTEKCTRFQKNHALDTVIDNSSGYRTGLNLFIDKYIKFNWKKFENNDYDSIFRHRLASHNFDDRLSKWDPFDDPNAFGIFCAPSLHTIILESYIYVGKILSDAYTMIAVAHLIRYGEYAAANETINAEKVLKSSAEITDEYFENMKRIMSTSKKTLGGAPREIQSLIETFDDLLDAENNVNIVTEFCPHLMQADAGFVITGIRWRIDNDVLMIDINQGKFISGNRVGEHSAIWKGLSDCPEYKPVIEDLKGVLLGDIVLGPEKYVTGVRMVNIDGYLTLEVRGLATNHNGTELLRGEFVVRPEIGNDRHEEDFAAPMQSIKFIVGDIRTRIPVPISGVGIYQDHQSNVFLRMISPDFNELIDEERFDEYRKFFKL